MLVEVNLGQEALPCVREELAAGNTPARKLLRLPLAQSVGIMTISAEDAVLAQDSVD